VAEREQLTEAVEALVDAVERDAEARGHAGHAPEIDGIRHWLTDDEARDLIEHYGWKVVDDLAKGKGGGDE
jgi:hypothetical protein